MVGLLPAHFLGLWNSEQLPKMKCEEVEEVELESDEDLGYVVSVSVRNRWQGNGFAVLTFFLERARVFADTHRAIT